MERERPMPTPLTDPESAPAAPGGTTVHPVSSQRTALLYWGARSTLRHLYRAWPLSDRGIRSLGMLENGFGRLPLPAGVDVVPTMLGGVPAETVTPTAPTDRALTATVVLYLHGGGFLFCSPETHRHLCRTLAVGSGAPVYSVRYRQLPEAGVGTAVDDAYNSFCALRELVGDEVSIVVAGDSAGGFLAAKICELAAADGIVGPAALVGYSPLLDLDATFDDGPWTRKDAFMPAHTVRRAQQLWDRGPLPLRGARSFDRCAPEIFPPTFLTTVENEVIEPAMLDFAARLRSAGVPVEVHRWRRGLHAFPVLDTSTPESRKATALTIEFLHRVLGGPKD